MPLPVNFSRARIKNKNPLVSVIIPTYNEEEDIVACLESLRNQTYQNQEVIVVDDGSTDSTIELIQKFGGVIIIKQAHQGPGAARNLGASEAKGEILVFIDADMVLFPDYIDKLIIPLISGEALGTIESIQYNVHTTKMQECWGNEVRIAQLEGANSSTVRGIAKENFRQLGGFDSSYGYADDRTFFLKYGIRFNILADVKCYHKTPPTVRGVFKHSRWIGASYEKGVLKYSFMRRIIIFPLFLLSPFMIIPLALRKSIQLNRMSLFMPWMVVFMTARYYGLLSGIFRREFLGINVR